VSPIEDQKSSQSGTLVMFSWAARPRPDESTMTISDPLPVAPAAGVATPKVLTEPAVVKFVDREKFPSC
jgi:hypothetical protein